MQTGNILQALFRGVPDSIREMAGKTTVSEKQKILLESGLHYTDPDRLVSCPLLSAAGSPILILEGFRSGRFVSSALFNERGFEVITSVECDLPPLTCMVKQGVPRLIKSPVELPLELVRKMGDLVLVCDGRSIFSRKTFRNVCEKSMLNIQIREIISLETLIDRI